MMTSAYDNLKLCSYMFAADSFDNCQKIFDSFSPLLESILVGSGSRTIAFLALKNKIDEIYNTKIPSATLHYLLDKLRHEGKIKIDKNYIYINGEMFDARYFQQRDEKEQQATNLFLSFREFMIEHNEEITFEQAKEYLCLYIFTHCFDLAGFIGGLTRPEQNENENSLHVSLLCDFIIDCRANKHSLYDTFLKLYKGAVQSTLLNFNPEKIKELQRDNLQISKVILDSNFVMRILDIQTELEGKMARETLVALKTLGIEIIVLQQSIEEIKQSIKAFLNEMEPYAPHLSEFAGHKNIRTCGLLSAMSRGKSRTELLELTRQSNLRPILEEVHEILIVDDYETPEKIDAEVKSLVDAKAKESYNDKQAIHDLALIYYCRINRSKHIDSFSDAKCWVLTNDIKLTYWNQKNHDKFEECITEGQLSNLIWLQQPKEDNLGLINTMVALANKEQIDPGKFHQFIDKMQMYKESVKNKKTETDNLSLIYACDCFTTSDVKRINEEEDGITPIINEKVAFIRKEQEEQSLKLLRSNDENASLKLKLIISEMELQKETYEKEIKENALQKEKIKSEKKELSETRDASFIVDKIKKKSGRVLTTSIIIGLVFLAILAHVIPSALKAVLETFQILDAQNMPEWAKSTLLEVAIFVGGSIITFIISTLATGRWMSLKDLYAYYSERIYLRSIKKQGFDPTNWSFCVEIADKRNEIEKRLHEQKKIEIRIDEILQSLEIKIKKIERDISDLAA